MKIILTYNFSTHRFYTTSGNTLKEAIMPWVKGVSEDIPNKANILDVMSGTGFTSDSFEKLGFETKDVFPFDVKSLFNKADATFEPLVLNEDWKLDFNNSKDFKFCPFYYSFKSGSRRFYVLNLGGMNIILSNYQKEWTVLPLKYPGDTLNKYVPVNKNN